MTAVPACLSDLCRRSGIRRYVPRVQPVVLEQSFHTITAMKKIIVAVTGASGAIYGRQTVERLTAIEEIGEIAVIFSENGRKVMEYERENIPIADPRIKVYGNDDLFAAPASGSSGYDAMVVVPCTVGSAGRIAAGISCDLIGRAADVMLKERHPLLLVVRETPLGTIHLRNLAALSECGAIILPASPSFYSRPSGVEELCGTVTDRIIKLLGLPSSGFSWGERTAEE